MFRKIFILFILALLPLAVFAQGDADSEYISDAVKEKLTAKEEVVEDVPETQPVVIISRESELRSAGSARDSPFYLIDRFMEKLRLRLTRDELTKLRLHLIFSEERLAEANKLVHENKLEHARATISAYEGELQEAALELEAAKNKGIDIEQAKQEIQQTTEKHMGILQSIYLGSPDTAKVVLSTAIQAAENSKELAIKVMAQVKEIAEEKLEEPNQEQPEEEETVPEPVEEEEEDNIEYKQMHKGWH